MPSHARSTLNDSQSAFFKATFSTMGYIAKANGIISQEAIIIARTIMQRLGLEKQHILDAIDCFNEGKQSHFNFINVMDKFRRLCKKRRNILRMFLLIQIEMAYADGHLHVPQRAILVQITEFLGFTTKEFARLESIYHGQHQFHREENKSDKQFVVDHTRLRYAYQLLGITPMVEDKQLKKSYRLLLSQYHPDKLVSKGLPDDLIKIATEKTIEVKLAYQYVCQARQFGSLH